MNLTEYQESATTLLLGQKRKKDRPPNNTAALIMQPSEAYSKVASSNLASPKHKNHKKSSQSLNPSHCSNRFLL